MPFTKALAGASHVINPITILKTSPFKLTPVCNTFFIFPIVGFKNYRLFGLFPKVNAIGNTKSDIDPNIGQTEEDEDLKSGRPSIFSDNFNTFLDEMLFFVMYTSILVIQSKS